MTDIKAMPYKELVDKLIELVRDNKTRRDEKAELLSRLAQGKRDAAEVQRQKGAWDSLWNDNHSLCFENLKLTNALAALQSKYDRTVGRAQRLLLIKSDTDFAKGADYACEVILAAAEGKDGG
jgi:hypothetical protein